MGIATLATKNSTDLAAWMKAVAPQLPGYQEFASPKSKEGHRGRLLGQTMG